ncbi:hypothetical protein CVT26_002958 [Gymnopilus dilepis]|uniref:Uncharacterized protein n=1 Tax=Gymnopilus dilepis TaxID=231916 RepID=A0A409VR49_9AGAR|nr:hypothetical protein CVT26_002958 [Gymnopilus dilepis]
MRTSFALLLSFISLISVVSAAPVPRWDDYSDSNDNGSHRGFSGPSDASIGGIAGFFPVYLSSSDGAYLTDSSYGHSHWGQHTGSESHREHSFGGEYRHKDESSGRAYRHSHSDEGYQDTHESSRHTGGRVHDSEASRGSSFRHTDGPIGSHRSGGFSEEGLHHHPAFDTAMRHSDTQRPVGGLSRHHDRLSNDLPEHALRPHKSSTSGLRHHHSDLDAAEHHGLQTGLGRHSALHHADGDLTHPHLLNPSAHRGSSEHVSGSRLPSSKDSLRGRPASHLLTSHPDAALRHPGALGVHEHSAGLRTAGRQSGRHLDVHSPAAGHPLSSHPLSLHAESSRHSDKHGSASHLPGSHTLGKMDGLRHTPSSLGRHPDAHLPNGHSAGLHGGAGRGASSHHLGWAADHRAGQRASGGKGRLADLHHELLNHPLLAGKLGAHKSQRASSQGGSLHHDMHLSHPVGNHPLSHDAAHKVSVSGMKGLGHGAATKGKGR